MKYQADIAKVLIKYDAIGHLDTVLKLHTHKEEVALNEEISDEDFLSWLEDNFAGEDTMDTVPRAWLTGVLHGFING
jgi:hypothetical protein